MKRLDSSPEDTNGISRLAIRFVAPVLLSLSVMLVAAVLSIELLSTIRAWVGGEGLYSKGQKNATYYLSEYTRSHAEKDLRLYQAAIAFPLGDWKARLALQRRPVDLEAVRAGFLEGGSAPADIDSIILVFRLFGNLGPVRRPNKPGFRPLCIESTTNSRRSRRASRPPWEIWRGPPGTC
jgi:hypothetical protein